MKGNSVVFYATVVSDIIIRILHFCIFMWDFYIFIQQRFREQLKEWEKSALLSQSVMHAEKWTVLLVRTVQKCLGSAGVQDASL